MTRAASVTGVARAKRYMKGVLSGEIPACKWVKRAVERQQQDVQRAKTDKSWPYRFDVDAANRICAFIEQLPHVSGRWAAQRKLITLEPWQCFVLCTLFGWLHKRTGKRRFRQAYLQVARKNAKSTLAAGIALYMLRYDGEAGAQVFSGATGQVQAMEVFRPAKQMVDRLEPYTRALALKTAAMSIYHEASGSFFKPVVGKPGDGSSPHCAIIDEYHEHATSELFDTMALGMGAREQPLALVITTAGSNIGGPCFRLSLECQKLLDGVYDDDSIFAIIYALDQSDDWTDPAVLIKANPNLGVSITLEDLAREQEQAARDASKQGSFRTKKLNEWVGASYGFFNMKNWSACAQKGLSLSQFHGRNCIIGVDLSVYDDITAIQLFFPPQAGEKAATFGFHHLPQQMLDAAGSQHFRTWAQEGLIQVHEGASIDHTVVLAQIIDLCRRFTVIEVPMDMNMGNMMYHELCKAGVFAVEHVQRAKEYDHPMRKLAALIDDKDIVHDGNQAMSWMMSNVVANTKYGDLLAPKKVSGANKIDGPVALMMAVGAWLRREATPPPPASPYETRGIVVIG